MKCMCLEHRHNPSCFDHGVHDLMKLGKLVGDAK